MSITIPGRASIHPPAENAARASGIVLIVAAVFVGVSLVLPHPSGADGAALLLTGAGMFLVGLLSWALAARIPWAGSHLLLAATALAAGALFVESGVAAAQFGAIIVWTTLVVSYFFGRQTVALHLAWILLVYGAALLTVRHTAGYSPLALWLFMAILLTVVALITTEISVRRARADQRANSFFELSRDMLATASLDGRFVELNESWSQCLGYTKEELRAIPFTDLVHPEDRARTEAEAARIFEGEEAARFENRYRAKDGSWRWLQWSSELAVDESLIYARATDVTALKRIETERQALFEQVEELTRSDSLTGLPNRRALDEQLPRELARARRHGTELHLIMLDIDHFKLYNDSHGHLAGDEFLRECARAWSGTLRGEDLIARFGGEEFVVLIPNCPGEVAERITERVRRETPGGQTCSAGIAAWDRTETGDQLLGRADAALYEAKLAGRNLFVSA